MQNCKAAWQRRTLMCPTMLCWRMYNSNAAAMRRCQLSIHSRMQQHSARLAIDIVIELAQSMQGHISEGGNAQQHVGQFGHLRIESICKACVQIYTSLCMGPSRPQHHLQAQQAPEVRTGRVLWRRCSPGAAHCRE